MSLTTTERDLLRDLAKRYVELASDPVMQVRRDARRKHNSLKSDRPLIYLRAFAWSELPESHCQISDPFWRPFENKLRQQLYWGSLQDDSVFEP